MAYIIKFISRNKMSISKSIIDQRIHSITTGRDLDSRTLRSLAIHFRLNLNDFEEEEYLLKCAVYEYLKNNLKMLEDIYVLAIIKAEKIDYERFEFLEGYSGVYVHHLLRWYNIADEQVLWEAFDRKESVVLTVGYVFDRAGYPPAALSRVLTKLNENLIAMDRLAKRASWFDVPAKKEAAEYIFFRRGHVKYWNAFNVHPELFFLDDKINAHEKEALFKDIRARYNLEMSRRVNPKKQCNFSIDPKAYALMERIRKKSGFKKSVLLEIIFSPENERFLHDLVKRKTTPPVLHRPTELVHSDPSEVVVLPSGDKIVVPLGGFK